MSQWEQGRNAPAGLVFTITGKRKIGGKIPARFWQDFLSVSTKNECRCITPAALIPD
jgi:hypothetical protein